MYLSDFVKPQQRSKELLISSLCCGNRLIFFNRIAWAVWSDDNFFEHEGLKLFEQLTIFSSFITFSDLFLKGNVRNRIWILGLKGLKGVFQDLKCWAFLTGGICLCSSSDSSIYYGQRRSSKKNGKPRRTGASPQNESTYWMAYTWQVQCMLVAVNKVQLEKKLLSYSGTSI